MSVCLFTPSARADLLQIHDYIAEHNPAAALEYIDRIAESCYRLADFPYMGRSRPELRPGYRSFAVTGTSYLVFYRPIEDGVEVVHIRHGSQDLRRLFEQG